MQFNSFAFLLFFVVFFLVYQGLKNRLRVQNAVLLVGSYIFYGWWDWRFLGLIALITVSTWHTALMSRRGHARLWTGVNIVLSIAILLVFKYLNFFSDGLNGLLALMGMGVDRFTADILLPVGISFYTFQAISYSVDVYRREIEPARNLIDFGVFLAFFPQLLAGPIERGRDLLPQIYNRRPWNYDLAIDGLRETLWGFFKKVAIADRCGIIVDRIFDTTDANTMHLTVAAILFTVQIYCDFSGYCNIARGVAAMLGFRLSVNFRYPLFAMSPVDFWRRWNITLTSWLRDYIYIPLGGNRRGTVRTCCNIMIVFVVSGLWHGAAINFILWGMIWGALVVVDHLSGWHKRRTVSVTRKVFKMTGMSLLTILTFVFFRTDNPVTAFSIVTRTLPVIIVLAAVGAVIILLCNQLSRRVLTALILAIVTAIFIGVAVHWDFGALIALSVWAAFPASIAVMLATEWVNRGHDFALARLGDVRISLKLATLWTIVLIIAISGASRQPFIYFQF